MTLLDHDKRILRAGFRLKRTGKRERERERERDREVLFTIKK